MRITDEAVEAALKARREFKNQRGMDNATNLMRHILEAAAPFIAAQAWDEGRIDGHDEARQGYDDAINPYRKEPK